MKPIIPDAVDTLFMLWPILIYTSKFEMNPCDLSPYPQTKILMEFPEQEPVRETEYPMNYPDWGVSKKETPSQYSSKTANNGCYDSPIE